MFDSGAAGSKPSANIRTRLHQILPNLQLGFFNMASIRPFSDRPHPVVYHPMTATEYLSTHFNFGTPLVIDNGKARVFSALRPLDWCLLLLHLCPNSDFDSGSFELRAGWATDANPRCKNQFLCLYLFSSFSFRRVHTPILIHSCFFNRFVFTRCLSVVCRNLVGLPRSKRDGDFIVVGDPLLETDGHRLRTRAPHDRGVVYQLDLMVSGVGWGIPDREAGCDVVELGYGGGWLHFEMWSC